MAKNISCFHRGPEDHSTHPPTFSGLQPPLTLVWRSNDCL